MAASDPSARHPEKIHRPDNPVRRGKPAWLRVKAPLSAGYQETRRLMRGLALHTVCEAAACPNIGGCWAQKQATFMILGDLCTRGCAFCNVATGRPAAPDPLEPQHVAEAVAGLGLAHVVITSVTRDDLEDGGATQFARTVRLTRLAAPDCSIELLTPDFRRCPPQALETVLAAGPDVFNHNVETVPRLYGRVRSGADYETSLALLERAKGLDPDCFTKSGLMVGLGETAAEIRRVMADLRGAGVEFLTIGQYLQPTVKHHEVVEFVPPEAFQAYEAEAYEQGFLLVSASPLTRSSHHAGRDFKRLQAARRGGPR